MRRADPAVLELIVRRGKDNKRVMFLASGNSMEEIHYVRDRMTYQVQV